MSARYVVGIDLGTTNSVVAYAPVDGSDAIRVLPIPQLVAPGTTESAQQLPSFLYLPPAGESKSGEAIVGAYARQRASEVPDRVVASAKSWLSYGGADRDAVLLPWGAGDDVPKLTPVAASAKYLTHLAAAWNAAFPKHLLAAQDVLLTVPASFDPAARERTVQAAEDAGLPTVTLLEEPQAALYAWLDTQGDTWRRRIRVGDLILVCDVGGGTTDFSLIAVSEHEGDLVLERVAVGDHILLGGDNMDLALARLLQQRLEEGGQRLKHGGRA